MRHRHAHTHTFRVYGGDRGQGLGGTGVRGDKGLSYHMRHIHTHTHTIQITPPYKEDKPKQIALSHSFSLRI